MQTSSTSCRSSSTTYSADAQLAWGLVPQSVLPNAEVTSTEQLENKYGVPLDTRHYYHKGKNVIIHYSMK